MGRQTVSQRGEKQAITAGRMQKETFPPSLDFVTDECSTVLDEGALWKEQTPASSIRETSANLLPPPACHSSEKIGFPLIGGFICHTLTSKAGLLRAVLLAQEQLCQLNGTSATTITPAPCPHRHIQLSGESFKSH